jgi:hypothetical protein
MSPISVSCSHRIGKAKKSRIASAVRIGVEADGAACGGPFASTIESAACGSAKMGQLAHF